MAGVQNQGFEEPAGMAEMPFGGAGVGHGLGRGVGVGQTFGQGQGFGTHRLKPPQKGF